MTMLVKGADVTINPVVTIQDLHIKTIAFLMKNSHPNYTFPCGKLKSFTSLNMSYSKQPLQNVEQAGSQYSGPP